MSPLPCRRVKLGAVVVVTVAMSAALGCVSQETTETAAAADSPPSYPDQRLVMPVNDLPGPYTRVHPWGEIPYDPENYDARAAVIGAAEGPDGNIYVLSRCNKNSCEGRKEPPIMKFNPDGKLLASWGVGLFEFPHNLTIDREGNVWTTDEGNHVVRKFTPTGELLMSIGEQGKAGDSPNHLTSPTGVAVAPDGNIFVTEGHDNSPTAPVARVSKWTADGKFIKTWGSTGPAPGQFSTPHTIAFDSQGRVFVGDRNNNRIQIFDQEGKYLDAWTQFSRPSGIYIDRNDMIYVADSESGSVEPANKAWKRGIRIGSLKDGKVIAFIPDPAENPPSTSSAEGLAVDRNGIIYGAEVGQRALKRYVKR